MKLLLALASDDTYDLISLYIRPLGFELVRYRHIVKAMDNLDEVDPAAVIISANDFPRHWKAMVQFIRAERPKEICPVIILTGKNFPLESTTQAFYIGVSGIVDETLSPSDLERLQTIISRYIPVDERRRARRFYAGEWSRFGLLISNPQDKTIIPGEIKAISSSGLSFSPAYSSLMKDIKTHTVLPQCSLRAGDLILSPSCRMVRSGRIVSLEFISFPPGEENILEKYLEELPIIEMRNKRMEIEESGGFD
ncbi:MAG: PilZ domain-containing protein [Treponema sp.]|jgi:DNA-binding response OmpR family regulator|nr:PilZ domain-containing protein [Treponema sp.]